MRTEMDQNGISMDTAEQQTTRRAEGEPTPPGYAVDQLAKQLDLAHLDSASSAAEAMHKAALNSSDPLVRINAIRKMSEFLSITSDKAGDRRSMLQEVQLKVQDKITAIAFGSEQPEVRLEAVRGLGNTLAVPTGEPDKHNAAIQLIAIISATSQNNSVKNEAIAILSSYSARKNINRGYDGSTTHLESQNYANAAIGVVSKPAPVPTAL